MSILTDFFVADETELAAVVDDGPAGRLPTVETNGVDPVKLATLSGIVTGRDYAVDAGFDARLAEVREVAHGGDEGPWIFELPGTLAAVLRDADDARITGFAREWAQTEEWVADGVPEEDLRDLLADVAHLANEAQPPKQLYLWMSL